MTKLHYYEQYVRENLFHNLPELYGHRLGCFCAPWQPCHIDVLLRLLYKSLEDASKGKENNVEAEATTPKTSKINKKNYCKRIICESDDEEHLAPVFGKKSKSVTTQT